MRGGGEESVCVVKVCVIERACYLRVYVMRGYATWPEISCCHIEIIRQRTDGNTVIIIIDGKSRLYVMGGLCIGLPG